MRYEDQVASTLISGDYQGLGSLWEDITDDQNNKTYRQFEGLLVQKPNKQIHRYLDTPLVLYDESDEDFLVTLQENTLYESSFLFNQGDESDSDENSAEDPFGEEIVDNPTSINKQAQQMLLSQNR